MLEYSVQFDTPGEQRMQPSGGGYCLDIVSSHKVLWPLSFLGGTVAPADCVGLCCRLIMEEPDCNLAEPPVGDLSFGNC